MSMKEAYRKKMEAQLNEWSAKIDVLKAKAAKAAAEEKIRYNEYIDSLQTKRQRVKDKLARLTASSESAWEQFKGEVDHAWDELKKAVVKGGEIIK